jgi:hypothetical protein
VPTLETPERDAHFPAPALGFCYDRLAGGDMKQPVERRLAAILAADVAGYAPSARDQRHLGQPCVIGALRFRRR